MAAATPELSRADEVNGGGSTAEMVNDDGCNGGERGSRRGGRGGARGADAGTTVAGAVLPSTTVLPCRRAPCCHPRPPSYCRAGAAVETRTTRGRRRRRRKMERSLNRTMKHV
uniref:DUF834 domain-containing protein n=1 Tax=Oryza rufipogon TaxID=4529 RepID=A0A0E0QSL7_ORYRU